MSQILHILASKQQNEVTKEDISQLIENQSQLDGTTPGRRADTIISWFKWLATTLGIVEVLGKTIRLPKQLKLDI